MRICSIEGCNTKHLAKGYCRLHYHRYRENDDKDYIERPPSQNHNLATTVEYGTWQGMRYDKATQGLAQVIEHPQNSEGLMIMCAGLSPEATLKFCDLELYDEDASFVIFDGDKELLRGDWEEVDNNLYWNFDTHPSVRSAPNEQ